MIVLSLSGEIKQALRQVTITVRILVKIVLVVVFRLVEVLQGQVLHGYLSMDMLLLFSEDLVDGRLVGAVGVIDTRTVLGSDVVALPVDARRVDGLEVHLQQEHQRHFVGIVSDMDCLSKAGLVGADILVSWILGCTVGIAYLSIHYAVNLLEVMLGAPEAATGQIYLFQILFFHIVPFYVLVCICLA